MDYKIIHLKTNSTQLYSWLAVTPDNTTIGHVFLQAELDNKVKFFDDFVCEDYRGYGIYKALWDKRWEYAQQNFPNHTAYAFCLPTSLNTYKKNGFEEQVAAIKVEKLIK